MNLTVKSLTALMAELPPVPTFRWYVIKAEYFRHLQAEIQSLTVDTFDRRLFLGAHMYPKAQVTDAWVFNDEGTCQKYLRDELTEADLLELAATGECSQQSFPA
jgi:hypothetical protein